MSMCNFGYFPIWFLGQNVGSLYIHTEDTPYFGVYFIYVSLKSRHSKLKNPLTEPDSMVGLASVWLRDVHLFDPRVLHIISLRLLMKLCE